MSDNRTLKTRPTCPKCGKLLDGYTPLVPNDKPRRGDVSICGYCANLMRFDGRPLSLRKMSAAEIEQAMAIPSIRAAARRVHIKTAVALPPRYLN